MTPLSRTAVAEWTHSAVSTPLASWYTESLCDAIGDRLFMFEPVLGAALDRLRLTVRGLQDLGLAAPGDGNSPARLDQPSDVLQLAFITLSLLLGRRITPSEYPWRIETLLNDFANASHGCS